MVVLSQEEIIRLLHRIRQPEYQTAIALAYGTGLKINELIHLKTKDVDLKKLTIHFPGRSLPLPVKLKTNLWEIIQKREPDDVLFLNKNNKQISRNAILRRLKIAAKRAHILKSVTFSALRHSFAVHLLEYGIEIKWIQKLLGHRDLRVTKRIYKTFMPSAPNIKSPLDLNRIPKVSGFLLY